MQLRHIWRPCSLAVAICLASGGILVSQSRAQETESTGGIQMSIGLNTTLRADDNYNLSFGDGASGVFSETKLSFGISFETQTQLFRLNANTGLRLSDTSDGGFDSTQNDPRVSLRYERNVADSGLTLTANYRRTALEFSEPLIEVTEEGEEPDTTDVTLVETTGSRVNYGGALIYEFGRESPFGGTLELRHQVRDYSDTTNTELFDTETTTLATGLRFDLSPVTSARLRFSQRDYQADDTEETGRVTRSYTLGVTQDINPVLVLEASLGQTTIETEKTVGLIRETTETSGTTVDLALNHERKDGLLRLSYSRSVGVNGGRDTFQVSRELEMLRGTLNGSLGATRGSSGNFLAIGRLAYSQELPRGALSTSLERSAGTNSLDEDVLTTRIGVTYKMDLTQVSSLSLGLNYARTEDGGLGSIATRDRTNFQASYALELTEDVNLNAGYRHRTRSEGGQDAASNSIFVTVNRSFALRP